MLYVKLLLQRKFNKHYLSYKQEKILAQVKETSFFSVAIAILWKALVLGFFGLLIAIPFYIMIVFSLSSNEYINDAPGNYLVLWPNGFHTENYADAISKGYWQSLLMTSIVTILSIIFKLFFSLFFGYAFSIKNWRFKKLFWWLFLSLLILPDSALIVGQFKSIVLLSWRELPTVVISLFLPFVASVFSGYMFRNAFEAIPDRIKEAALVDGCNNLRYLVKVAMPMVQPTTLTVLILTAFASWNAYLWPLLILDPNDVKEYTVLNLFLFKVGIPEDSEVAERIVLQGAKMAGNILVILPTFAAFFVFRSKIMGSISRQGKSIKG